jgi:signal-transduction protein with cAMP-binding, CBS, and nucleotidyltransferase domain
MKTGITVRDAMTKSLVRVEPNVSVQECAQLMLDKKVGGLIVQEADVTVGIVTEKDIVAKVVAKKLDSDATLVQNIMSSKLIGIDPSKDLYDAVVLMAEENIRRLPVMFEGRVVGLLTAKDVLKIEPQLINYLAEKFQIREEDQKAIFFKSQG